MANQILAGAVFQAGQVIAGVDANNPPYVGPPAHWAETQYGVGGGGGGTWSDGSATAIQFNVMQNDTSGVDILTNIANNLDDNEVFKLEFRNSNKVVHSYDSPSRIIMNQNPPRDVPFYESTYYKTWQLNILSSGPELGTQHDPSKTLSDTYNPVNARDVTAPRPSIDVDPTSGTNIDNLASFDQVIFYNQSGGLIDYINLSSTRTGNGFDADGSASQATSLISVVNPSFPTFERVMFRSRAIAQGSGASTVYPMQYNVLDPSTMTVTQIPATGITDNEISWGFGQKTASNPSGSLLAICNANDTAGLSYDTPNLSVGAVYVYDSRNLTAGPIAEVREPITRGAGFADQGIAMTDTHLYVSAPNKTPNSYETYPDNASRNAAKNGVIYKYDLSDLSASPEEITGPVLTAQNTNPVSGDPANPSFGAKLYISGDKLFVYSSEDYSGHTVLDGRVGRGVVYVYDTNDTSAPTHTIVQDGWYGFGGEIWFDGDDVWIRASQPSHNYDTYTNDHGSLWKYSLSDLSAAPTVEVNPEDFRGASVGGSNGDRFGQQVVFTDTKIIISSAHEYKDFPQEGYKGYIYIMNKDGSQKQTLTNLPPNHREEWTVFGRYMTMAAGKLFISRYSPYGQDTSPGGYFPDGNGELWIYDPENLGAAPVLWDEAGVIHKSEEIIDSEIYTYSLQV